MNTFRNRLFLSVLAVLGVGWVVWYLNSPVIETNGVTQPNGSPTPARQPQTSGNDVGNESKSKVARLVKDEATYRSEVSPFLNRYCLECHGPKEQKGKLRLDNLAADFRDGKIAAQWVEVMDRLNLGEMPPKKSQQPDAEELKKVVHWIADELRHAARHAHVTGDVCLRRLSRREYANTVRDLLAVEFLPGEGPEHFLPPDGSLDGIDRHRLALTVDPSLMEAYLHTARIIVDKAIVTGPQPVATEKHRFEFEDAATNPYVKTSVIRRSVQMTADGLWLFADTAPTPPLKHSFNKKMVPIQGRYTIRLRAGADPGTSGEPVLMKIWRGGDGDLFQSEVNATRNEPKIYEFTTTLSPGGNDNLNVILLNGSNFGIANLYWHQMEGQISKLVSAENLNEAGRLRAQRLAEGAAWYSSPNPKTLHTADLPRLYLDWIEIEGPLYEQWPPKSHQRILFAEDDTPKDIQYARTIFERLLPRAYRQPIGDNDLAPVLNVVAKELNAGEPFEEAIRVGLMAVLCSPKFLYLREPTGEGETRKATDHQLASRLSYFLWASMPDEPLFQLAAANKLHNVDVLDTQVDRMLADPRAEGFVQGFAAQWLRVDEFNRFPPDRELYPKFYRPEFAGLDADMRSEALHFFREVLQKDQPVFVFLDSDWAMLNQQLATFYGIPGIKGESFRKVSLPAGSHRGGLLGMAGVHRLGSDGNRTKPVTRAKYILEVLLNNPSDPPPPSAGEVEPNVQGHHLTVRQRLEAHQSIPACASCHQRLDPYGFALENYNAIGEWRDVQDGEKRNWGNAPKIDASGVLPDGRTFAGIEEFKDQLLGSKGRFLRALSERLLTYALCRSLKPSDRPTVDRLVQAMAKERNTLRSLIKAIVKSPTFQAQ